MEILFALIERWLPRIAAGFALLIIGLTAAAIMALGCLWFQADRLKRLEAENSRLRQTAVPIGGSIGCEESAAPSFLQPEYIPEPRPETECR